MSNKKLIFSFAISLGAILLAAFLAAKLIARPTAIPLPESDVTVGGQEKEQTPPSKTKPGAEATKSTDPLTLTNVFEAPGAFEGKHIKLDAYYYDGGEEENHITVLASRIITNKSGWRSVIGPSVWVNWGIKPDEALLAKLHRLPSLLGEYNSYGRVEVEGIFRDYAGSRREYKYEFLILSFRVFDEKTGQFFHNSKVQP